MKQPKVVVIGGGTGIYPVVSALKKLPVEITTIIAVSDSGGSTGRIRDEFGFPPVGDLRQSLAALAKLDSQKALRDLLLYRFGGRGNLRGHNLGNLILTALQDTYKSTTKALQVAQKIFRIQGAVVPSTDAVVNLRVKYHDGTTVIGEHILDEQVGKPKKIVSVNLTPKCAVNPAAKSALIKADFIIIGPGDLYASLMAVLVTPGLTSALKRSQTPITYFLNLMTRHSQTHNMTAHDHVLTIEKTLGFKLDHIIVNSDIIPQTMLAAYKKQQEFPVLNDLIQDPRVLSYPLLQKNSPKQSNIDTVNRSLLRHSSKKILPVIKSLLSL